MSLYQWRTGGGRRERAQRRRGRVSHERRGHLGELSAKKKKNAHKHTQKHNHDKSCVGEKKKKQRHRSRRDQQTVRARTTQTCIQRIWYQSICHLSPITEPFMEYCDRNSHSLRAPWCLLCLKGCCGGNVGLVRLSKSKKEGWGWAIEGGRERIKGLGILKKCVAEVVSEP